MGSATRPRSIDPADGVTPAAMTAALPGPALAPPEPGWFTPARILAIILGLATLVRLLIASGVGFLTGDDVEVLEAAFVSATGLDYRPWEIRNLFFPRLLVSPVLALAGALGVHDPFWLVRIAALPFVALTAISGWLVYRLAVRLTDVKTALLAAGISSFHWLPLAYGGTVYPRTASTTCILLAALLLIGDGRELAREAGAGALVALAFADRYSEAIFLGAFLLFALRGGRSWAARLRGVAGLGLGFVAGALVTVGLCDLYFWGKPFASLVAFARYTLLEKRASAQTVHQPLLWYLMRFYLWLPPTLLPLFLTLRRRSHLLLPWLSVSVPLLLLSLIHHKELRYLQGVVPFLAILLAAGAASLWYSGRRRWTVALLSASLLLSLNMARSVLSRRSIAAVEAAHVIRADPTLKTVALSQAWAYGHRLFFGNGVAVLDLSTPPTDAEVRTAIARADAVALYVSDVARSPNVGRLIDQAGLVRAGEFRGWNSKPVVLFRRTPTAAAPGAAAAAATSRLPWPQSAATDQGAPVAVGRCQGRAGCFPPLTHPPKARMAMKGAAPYGGRGP